MFTFVFATKVNHHALGAGFWALFDRVGSNTTTNTNINCCVRAGHKPARWQCAQTDTRRWPQDLAAYGAQVTIEWCIDDERQFKTAMRSQAPGDATVLKRFFCDNFVVFRRRSKRIAFLESVNFSTYACMQLSIFVMVTWPLFGNIQGLYLPNAWPQALPTSKRHTFSVSAFHQYHWFGVKLFPVGCTQDSRRVP